ncbi:MAG: hypothetical protein QXJ49_02230 [Nitrososphaerota archaeon]
MTDNEPRVIEVSPLSLPPPRVLGVGKYPAPRVLEILEVRGERRPRWPFRKLR